MKAIVSKIDPYYDFSEGYSLVLKPDDQEKRLGVKEHHFIFLTRKEIYNDNGAIAWWNENKSVYSCNLKWFDQVREKILDQKLKEYVFKWPKPMAKVIGLLLLTGLIIFLAVVAFGYQDQPFIARIISTAIIASIALVSAWYAYLFWARGYLIFC